MENDLLLLVYNRKEINSWKTWTILDIYNNLFLHKIYLLSIFVCFSISNNLYFLSDHLSLTMYMTMYICFSGTNDLYIGITSGYMIERCLLKWKVTTLCRRHDFKGIFVHVNDSISGKFLDESFRSLSYLSRTTWIIAFGCL